MLVESVFQITYGLLIIFLVFFKKKRLFAVKSLSSVLRPGLTRRPSMWHLSSSCRRFFKTFFSRQVAVATTCSVRTREAWKLWTWLAYPYFPVWHFLNKVPVIVPVLNRCGLIISSMMRQSSCYYAIPYRRTHRHFPSHCRCLLSSDSSSTLTFWHIKFKQKE